MTLFFPSDGMEANVPVGADVYDLCSYQPFASTSCHHHHCLADTHFLLCYKQDLLPEKYFDDHIGTFIHVMRIFRVLFEIIQMLLNVHGTVSMCGAQPLKCITEYIKVGQSCSVIGTWKEYETFVYSNGNSVSRLCVCAYTQKFSNHLWLCSVGLLYAKNG
jgi:hypothetical protein